MKIVLTFFLFWVVFSGKANASQWEKDVLNNVAKADAANCAQYPKVSNLDEQFLCEDLLIKVSNSLYKNWLNGGDRAAKNQSIAEWWLMEDSSSLKSPLIKLHLAALLGQSSFRNLTKQREYARKYLFSNNELIQGNAIIAIAWVGNCDDAKDIIAIIKMEKEGIAEEAVLSLLTLLGTHKSVNRLTVISGDLKRDSLKKFIEKQLSNFG
ncbi:hypothetical protein [Pseudoalteromonas sp. 1_2015MBL_MicDiv]|uniref:hypothetical protein n=1 Tax=Pseudoalteromonas sp. 1_2015MBL_MicDiv TaxID=1720343 RepID=UPI000BBE2D74|nr:hypothetical protein [Pseudoalteromonas sp. 1_2015MBL_MicDiv]ATG76223.1 hypothetical protein AOR04_00945 [Pseudoalteromonas sp. 1_2015MBL_MicDiv]